MIGGLAETDVHLDNNHPHRVVYINRLVWYADRSAACADCPAIWPDHPVIVFGLGAICGRFELFA